MVPRPSQDRSWSALGVRSLWALLLAPPTLAALYFGPPYSDILVVLLGGLGAWEWARLCGRGKLDQAGVVLLGTVVVVLITAVLRAYPIAGWVAAVGTMGAAVAAGRVRQQDTLWYGLGAAYISAACLAFFWLRDIPDHGRWLVLWLVIAVWATDTGAYFAGRSIGGPKLVPTISPGKTWAGLLGGVCAAGLVGAFTAILLDVWGGLTFVVASMALALVSQVGDLFESSLKRQFDAKDSGDLIPGHGGVLDRIDGILAAVLMLGSVIWFMGSTS